MVDVGIDMAGQRRHQEPVVYCVGVASFQDSNGDRLGHLHGLQLHGDGCRWIRRRRSDRFE